ncbi:unnamed protein product [Adineta steineri]|uniref:Fibronectin type-III domain-containing protein n=1 Tax=Adineta steineri TaxID=433720 RepID=A0A815DM27_9BILA|nr:unnamed protein product [Adineta steineri]CAF1303369.1 unnamed protein product [Adineta steineri]
MDQQQTKLETHEELFGSANSREIQIKKTKFKQFAITVAGGNGYGDRLDHLSNPEGIFIDNDKSIYIADSLNNRIVKWKLNSNTGEIIAGGNRKENQNNQLNHPINIIFDKENNSFIISDWGNERVIRYFHQNQTSQQIIISNIYCLGLTIDKNGFIYASDWINHEVRRYKQGDGEGELVAGGNDQGNQLNQLNGPTFIFADDDCSLYISDSFNHRVMKWEKDAKEGIIVAGGNDVGDSLKQLNSPSGVIVDHLGQIYVADMKNHRVMRWCKGDEEGEIVVGENGEGSQLNGPREHTSELITLQWTRPQSDGKNPVRGYLVEKKEKETDQCILVNRQPVAGAEYTVAGLVDGKEYEFCVAAVNRASPGEYAKAKGPIQARPPDVASHAVDFSAFTLKEIIVRAGEDLKTTVPFVGSPTPQVTFAKNGDEIKPDGNNQVTVKDGIAELIVPKVKGGDTDLYSCTLKNHLGQETVQMKVIVVDKPDTPE